MALAATGCNQCSKKANTVPPDGGINGGDGGPTPDAGPFDAGSHPSDVLTHRRDLMRGGVYIDPSLTKAAVMSNMKVDPNFAPTISANTYSQPLFMEAAIDGGDVLFVATEGNDVYALDPLSGRQIWSTHVGAPASKSGGTMCKGSSFCGGSIDPFGISGTPAIDRVARILYLDAMLNNGHNGDPSHHIIAMGLDQGNILWNIDVDTAVSGFDSCIQNERSAVMLFNGRLYVVYGGLDGDCGNYHGWVVGVSTADHTQLVSWATAAPSGSGIWGTSGAASDGTSVFVATTNTNGPMPQVWDGGHSEAILKLTPDLRFIETADNFFTMSQDARNQNHDWLYNDANDLDLGSSGVVLFDAPGANPSQLAFAVGKTQYGYLVDRNHLGGISPGISAVIPGTDAQVFGSLLAYNTAKPATYVSGHFNVSGTGFCQNGGADLTVLQVSHSSPPNLQFAWCGATGGDAAPIVSTTDGSSEAILWTYGASGDETVRAYDADTGTLLYTSATPFPGSTHWISPIIAQGRLYVAGNGVVSALTVH